ncbi:glycosyl hydrolase family 18 protein [Cytobacillus spongiae]|uniref:glycosyl hydrolase family 18 protein n=1 Tax=Cytobacillus spongiae TaxID=2901381 RepID=UPI001F40681B|nr:glycosyl hydrolase family 18 protein [Cytobacillus spongiae]UII54137.1 glycosyl hydrolase family 18 protein [Cytobacillus spongiae]
MARTELHSKKPLSKAWIIAGLVFAFFLIISSSLLILYPFASKERTDYFIGEHPILYKGEQVGNAVVENNTVYVPLSFMKQYVDDSIAFDEKSNSIIITTKDKVIQMPSESLTYYVNEKPVKLQLTPITDQQGELYISLDPILAYYPIQYDLLDATKAIWIEQDGDERQVGTIHAPKAHEEKLRLRSEAHLQSPYYDQASNGETVFVEKEEQEFYYIRKENGVAGYIHKEFVQKEEKRTVSIVHEQKEATLPIINGPIQLTWEAVYSKNPDISQLPAMPGVNVVSPTWFELSGEDGSIKNLGSLDYVNWAKKRGYQVWALFSNAFDPELTHTTFKDYETRQKMIRQLLHYSQMYQLDGINIDIENVNIEDGPLITQFVREGTPYFHEAGLIVSMDINFISNSGNWSAFYEREKLAEIVDYLMVMAYDEHWGSSPVAGSVASLPWVEENLQKLLEVVPNEKLILGVPLYTRIWEEKANGEVSSKAWSMKKVKEWLKTNNVKSVYDETTGQNYAEHYSEGDQATYKIWLEDEVSLQKRAELANKYDLAGVASWSRFFADDTAWTALNLDQKQVTKK